MTRGRPLQTVHDRDELGEGRAGAGVLAGHGAERIGEPALFATVLAAAMLDTATTPGARSYRDLRPAQAPS